jgi:hypothetical protein
MTRLLGALPGDRIFPRLVRPFILNMFKFVRECVKLIRDRHGQTENQAE